MAVSKAIQSGETESVGNLKDILSGVVASHCVSSRLSLCTPCARRKSKRARSICWIASRAPNFYS